MASRPAEGAVLVVRIWREQEVTGFRGRITYRLDAAEAAETVVAFNTPARLHAAVQDWLDGYLRRTSPQSPPETR